jgi:hypothetical protein
MGLWSAKAESQSPDTPGGGQKRGFEIQVCQGGIPDATLPSRWADTEGQKGGFCDCGLPGQNPRSQTSQSVGREGRSVPFTTTHGTYLWGGSRALVSWAALFISSSPLLPSTQLFKSQPPTLKVNCKVILISRTYTATVQIPVTQPQLRLSLAARLPEWSKPQSPTRQDRLSSAGRQPQPPKSPSSTTK